MRPMKTETSRQGVVEAEGLSMVELLAELAAGNDENYSRLMEAIYYSFEDDLMTIIKLIAALEAADREKIREFAKSLPESRMG